MKEIQISVMKPSEISEVMEFLKRFYQPRYGSFPTSLLDVTFIAKHQEGLLGVISLELGTELSEIENFFDFDFSIFPYGSRADSVNFGRWASTVAIAGKALAYAAVSHALEKTKKQAVAVSHPFVLNYLRSSYGLEFHSFEFPLKGIQKKFFSRAGPKPRVYCGLLEQWRKKLKDLPSNVYFGDP